jgi:hypothetical protein
MTLLHNRTLLAVILGHLTIDTFNGMLSILYPLLGCAGLLPVVGAAGAFLLPSGSLLEVACNDP